jgi:outer membrane protein assembly factor BamB
MSVTTLSPNSLRLPSMLLLAAVVVSTSCVRGNRDRSEPGVELQCLSSQVPVTSAVLHDSHWLRIGTGSIEKLSPTGELAWSTKLPSSDPLLPGLSVAANNTVYMRDKQRVLALGSEGTWLWERPEPIQGSADPSYQPSAMSDSGVVVRSGRQQYRAYSHTGALRWSVDVDLKGGPSEKPMVLPNGLIILRGVDDSVCLSPDDGKVEWRQGRG